MTDAERIAQARVVAAEWHEYALRARRTLDGWPPLTREPFARGLDAGHAAMGHALGCVLGALGAGPAPGPELRAGAEPGEDPTMLPVQIVRHLMHGVDCSPACVCRQAGDERGN